MNKDDVIKMSIDADRSANSEWIRELHEDLWQECRDIIFAKLVAAAEREECAKACDRQAEENEENASCEMDERFLVYAKHQRRCASAIRNRSQK